MQRITRGMRRAGKQATTFSKPPSGCFVRAATGLALPSCSAGGGANYMLACSGVGITLACVAQYLLAKHRTEWTPLALATDAAFCGFSVRFVRATERRR